MARPAKQVQAPEGMGYLDALRVALATPPPKTAKRKRSKTKAGKAPREKR